MTEWLHFQFSPSCSGQGNGNNSSVLAWRITGMGEPGGLLSMGSHRVGHDCSDLAAAAAGLTERRLWCPAGSDAGSPSLVRTPGSSYMPFGTQQEKNTDVRHKVGYFNFVNHLVPLLNEIFKWGNFEGIISEQHMTQVLSHILHILPPVTQQKFQRVKYV